MRTKIKSTKYAVQLILERAIREGVAPGFACAWIKDGRQVTLTVGNHSQCGQQIPVDFEDSYFDVASVTKAYVATGIWILITQNKLALDAKVVEILPELGGEYRQALKVRHLLAYQAFFHHDLCNLTINEEPGLAFQYRNYPSYILGKIIERLVGKPLDVALNELLFNPLWMRNTYFSPKAKGVSDRQLVPTTAPFGIVHDPFTQKFAKPIGSSGIFGTTKDGLRFVNFLLEGCKVNDQPFVSLEIFEEARTNQSRPQEQPFGLGYYKFGSSYLPNQKQFIEEAIMMTGFTGCMIAAHIEAGFGFVLNSFAESPTDLGDEERKPIFYVRRDVLSVLLE